METEQTKTGLGHRAEPPQIVGEQHACFDADDHLADLALIANVQAADQVIDIERIGRRREAAGRVDPAALTPAAADAAADVETVPGVTRPRRAIRRRAASPCSNEDHDQRYRRP